MIERVTPENAFQPVSPGEAAFRSGEFARMDIYEEKPDIHKQAVLREEVRIRKQVEQEMVNSEEQVRREELDVDTEGRPIVDKNRWRILKSHVEGEVRSQNMSCGHATR